MSRFKRIMLGLFVVALVTIPTQKAKACEIEFEVKDQKEFYQKGDKIVVTVVVTLTHRSCPEALKKTKFKMQGLKVVKSTPWKQITKMEHRRKLLMIVTDDTAENLVLNAIRTCDKDGGFGALTLSTSPPEKK